MRPRSTSHGYLRLLFLLSIAFVLLPFAITTHAVPKAIRVMTFNIRYNEPRDGVNAWPNRKEKAAKAIESRADLCGVQEAQIGQLRDLEKLLPDFAWVGVGRTDGKEGGEFSAILYRRSRFKLLKTETFWLSQTPQTAGSMGWDAAFPRIVTWAKFSDLQTGKTFFHFNTHFDHRGETARLESAKLLVSKVHEIAARAPWVVTGDFNARESTGIYKTLTAGVPIKFIDARYASKAGHLGPTSTFNEFKELIPDMKIDYIFVGAKTKVLKHEAVADRPGGLWLSDHLPVVAEIVF